MSGTDVIAYAFDGEVYCLDCIGSLVPKCRCRKDANGLCEENCHGYGPNPVFAYEEHGGDSVVCGACLDVIVEAETVRHYCPECGMEWDSEKEATDCCAFDFGPDITGEGSTGDQ